MARREAVCSFGTSLATIFASGCLFGINDGPDSGALVISNDHAEAQTITATVTKTSDDSDDARSHDEGPAAGTTLIREREQQFSVGAGSSTTEEGFITEPGAFFVGARAKNGARTTNWAGFYAAGKNGESIGGGVIHVDVYEDGRIAISVVHDD